MRSQLGEQQRLGDEEEGREDAHPGEGLTAALGDAGDRVNADDRADEEEENVEAPEVPAQFLSLNGRSGGRAGRGCWSSGQLPEVTNEATSSRRMISSMLPINVVAARD